jgi:restriction endonuclease
VVPYFTLKMSVSKKDIIIRLHERGINPGHEVFSQEVRYLVFELLDKNQENVSEALSEEIEEFVKYFQNKTKLFYVSCHQIFNKMLEKNAGFFDLPKIFKNFGPVQPPPDQPRPVRPHPNPMVS